MQDTIRRIERRVMLCPMSRQECLRYDCAVWNPDTCLCVIDPAGLYTLIREAATDAAVDCIRYYRESEEAREAKKWSE